MMNFIICLLIWFSDQFIVESARSTIDQPPVIDRIYPFQGSTEGGTWLTIYGEHFLQGGLDSYTLVTVGGQECKQVEYYTYAHQITCLTPSCKDRNCIGDIDYSGTIEATIQVTVATDSTILTAYHQSFTYNGYYTGFVNRMSHYTFGTHTPFFSRKTCSSTFR
jgi:hypothetical protein